MVSSFGSTWSVNNASGAAKGDFEITGSIDFSLAYNNKSGSLNITVASCTDLAAADKKKLSNP